MRKALMILTCAALAACAEAEAPEAPEADAAAAAAAPAATGVMNDVGGPGTYEVTYGDGSVGTLVSREDGTFTATMGEETATGTIVEEGGKICFDGEGEEPPTRCWTNGPLGADGTFSSTADDGETVTVKRIEA